MAPKTDKIGPHHRHHWIEGEWNSIEVHNHLSKLKGTHPDLAAGQSTLMQQMYQRAKTKNDMKAAALLVRAVINGSLIEQLVTEVIKANKPVRIVCPHPEFDSDDPYRFGNITNAIPQAFTAYIARELGATIDTEIYQIARVGRTTLKRMERFLWQPRFSGKVDKDVAYVLVDDCFTLGGTLAMLRSHIAENGGTVVYVTALTTTSGASCTFGIANATLNVLKSAYGEELSPYWIQEIGHDIACLTQNEGFHLIEWGKKGASDQPLLRQLRNSLDKAKAS